MHPNPVVNTIIITIPDDLVLHKVKINDLTGKEIIKIQNPSQTINVTTLPKGIYFIVIDYGTFSHTTKFINPIPF